MSRLKPLLIAVLVTAMTTPYAQPCQAASGEARITGRYKIKYETSKLSARRVGKVVYIGGQYNVRAYRQRKVSTPFGSVGVPGWSRVKTFAKSFSAKIPANGKQQIYNKKHDKNVRVEVWATHRGNYVTLDYTIHSEKGKYRNKDNVRVRT